MFLAGMVSCATSSPAQETDDPQDNAPAEVAEVEESAPERRVRRLGDVGGDEFELDLAVPRAPKGDGPSSSEFDLPDPEQNARLQQILSTLATRPGNAAALAQLDSLLSSVLTAAHTLADEGRLDETAHLLRVVRNVNPQKTGLDQAFKRLEDLHDISTWLASGDSAFKKDLFIEPEGAGAVFYYRKVLRTDPQNSEALAGLLGVQQGLIDRAVSAARDFDFELAEKWLGEASKVRGTQDLVDEARVEIAGFRAAQAQKIEQDVLDAIVARKWDYAEFILIDLIALGGNEDRVAILRERLRVARTYGRFTPGEIIQDFLPDQEHFAPPVIVIAAGSFLMGSPETDKDRPSSEGPQHRVTITRGFALGLKEVSVGQFRVFAEATGYKTQAELEEKSWVYNEQSSRLTARDRINWRHDFQGRRARDDQPVLHVDWHDAKAYVKWLSEQTGQAYRLPSEAEWEYAIRAGSVTPYWWGEGSPVEVIENLTGDGDTSSSGRSWGVTFEGYDDGYWGTAPTGSFPANAFGLHDLAGNVSEWIEDCWHGTYVRAPVDGSAWVNPGCGKRVVRGGYWASSPGQAHSSARFSADSRLRGPRVGFRVARDL
jgi:formylglycine-generating enzyme required for sulfatase activity